MRDQEQIKQTTLQTMKTLSESEVKLRLKDLPDWQLRDEIYISKTYGFDTYLGGLSFLNTIAAFAEELNHHPTLTLDYKKLTVCWTTHDIGGLPHQDFDCAQKCDAQFEAQLKKSTT